MIAASEPQEFVPSGRQQALRHPGPQHGFSNKQYVGQNDEFLDKFEMVSLREKETELWVLRKAHFHETGKKNKQNEQEARDNNQSYLEQPTRLYYSDLLEDSYSFKSVDGHYRSNHTENLSNRRFSHENSMRKEDPKTVFTGISPNSCFKAKNQIDYMEDELYVKGHTAIWSRGLLNCDNLDNGRKVLCAYTSEQPIKHAFWCTFYLEHAVYESDLFQLYNKPLDPIGIPVNAVCIIDSHNIKVFTPKGEDFVTAIPFQIGKTWNTKFGIFLEKESDSGLNISMFDGKATLFSLAFPLDEVCPVAINNGVHTQILNNNNLKVVFTSEEPSICMIYDIQTKQHSIYKIRKVTNSEKTEFVSKMNNTCPSTTSLSNKLKNRFSMWDCSKNQGINPTSLSSRPTSVASFHNIHHSKSYSSMATISRCQTPATSSIGSPWLQRASRLTSFVNSEGNNLKENCSFFNSSKIMSYLHTNPTICLEHIWTDHHLIGDENVSCSTNKVFFCDDLIGQWYLCYILSTKFQLCMVRVDFSDPSNITFGMLTSISAKDAVPIPALHLLAILEHNDNVSLYSGLNPVGKLHIGGTLVQHTPSPYVKRNLQQFTTPCPRRSSLLPHLKPGGDVNFDDHLLSPVLPEQTTSRLANVLQLNFQLETNLPKVVLNGLRDPIENRITLRYSDGTYYRISMPPLTVHPLVESCLITLRQCLVKDTASVLLTRWYASRNSFGAQAKNLEQEWDMFAGLLSELLGYEIDSDSSGNDCPVTPSSNPKRQKHSLIGTNADWAFLQNSDYGMKLDDPFRDILNLSEKQRIKDTTDKAYGKINPNSLLFSSIRVVHFCLHLLYEDLKLDVLRSDDLKLLAKFLSKLAGDLGMSEYLVHYWKDFPEICDIYHDSNIESSDEKFINVLPFCQNSPISIMQFLCDLISGNVKEAYPYLKRVNDKSKDILQICAVISKEFNETLPLENLLRIIEPTALSVSCKHVEFNLPEGPVPVQATLLMTQKKITVRDLDTLPPAIYLLFYSALWKCRDNPPSDFPPQAYLLLWREDLAAQAMKIDENKSPQSVDGIGINFDQATEIDHSDGMGDVDNVLMRLRFPDDVRALEARKMLCSSKPVPIILEQRPCVSDHDFMEEKEKHLYAICSRTMALSIGRGMFTLRTSTPVITEPLETPPLCLAGRVPRGTTVELHHIDTPSNMNLWPLFHNGVANGLRITPDAEHIDNTWIIFNKPKTSVEQHMEHAGFLMALGLNGHLKKFDVLNTYNYLMKLHEMTSIGILLGLSAAYRGTCDVNMTKTLSIHVEALLPPTSMELDVHQNVQVAALLGIGLVYQGTSHRHIIEVLLSEIGRPPGPEMENSIDRESYSLAAGFSLGLVTLKQGTCSLGLSDLNVPDRLYYYMMGGNRKPLTGAQKDKYKVASFQIREGPSVNLDVTAPGATIALGLMYLGSGNKAVADWMAPPDTQYMLDFVRPDFLMFRILSRSLILWDEIEPTQTWVEHQVPPTIRPYCMKKPINNSDIDFEAMNQAYCNIITGACFALGLKYAGSANEEAFQVLLHYCHMFTNLTIKSIAEIAGKPTIETCLNVLLISASMVMAGTGNLDIMRLVRLLRKRVGVASSAVVTYGSHMALHMALGLLFLGGGRYTLSNSSQNIAALICAFYPKFPTHSNDNRYHLQAFRHLYVLAVEPRVIIPKDVHLGKICYANLKIIKLDDTVSYIRGPGIVPDINTLKAVRVDDERYWPVVFERGRNWELLIKILSNNGFIEVKQRAGCLSYLVDKLGYHSQLARTLTQSEIVPWDPPASSIISFTQDQTIKSFCKQILMGGTQDAGLDELKIKQLLTTITYDAVVKDKLIIISVFTFLAKVLHQLKSSPSAINFWQIKLIFSQIITKPISTNLISAELILAIEQQIIEKLEIWEIELKTNLRKFVKGDHFVSDSDNLRKLAVYVLFYDIPFNDDSFGKGFLEVLIKYRNQLSMRNIKKIFDIVSPP